MQIDNLHSNKNSQFLTNQDKNTEKSKKKSLLQKKKKIPQRVKLLQNIAIKHVVNIGDICFMNQDALRNPDSTSQSLLTSVYHYNMISKVSLNSCFVNIELKRNYDNFLPPQYFIERLRSFGDKQMASMALNLEKIHHQFSMIKQTSPALHTPFSRQKQEIMLKNFIANRQGKKYFLFFSEISPQKITMKNIIFSVPLLEALGCNVNSMSADFIRYKHVFLEVFTAKNYGHFVQGCFQKFFQIQAQIMENPNMDEDERRKLTEMIYQEEVIRKISEQNTEYEQVIRAKVAWFTPHPSICCFQILDIDQNEVQRKTKRIKLNKYAINQDKDLKLFKTIGIDYGVLEDHGIDKRVGQMRIQRFKRIRSYNSVGKSFSLISNQKRFLATNNIKHHMFSLINI